MIHQVGYSFGGLPFHSPITIGTVGTTTINQPGLTYIISGVDISLEGKNRRSTTDLNSLVKFLDGKHILKNGLFWKRKDENTWKSCENIMEVLFTSVFLMLNFVCW